MLKCTPLGGVRRSLAVAAGVGLPVVVSSAIETGVGMAAELALAGALPRLELACGLGTRALLTGDVTAEPSDVDRGSLAVPLAPPEPDEELLDRYAQRDPARRAWWLDRLSRARARLRSTPA